LTEPTESPVNAVSSPETEIADAIEREDTDACRAWQARTSVRDAVYAVSKLSGTERARLIGMLDTEEAAELLAQLPRMQAADAIEGLDAELAAGIIEELPSDERADLINALDEREADAILDELDASVADDVRMLAAYDEDTAGGLMSTEYLAFREDRCVRDILEDLEQHADKYASYNIQYTYIVDHEGRLIGVVPFRRLLLSKRSTPLRDIMIHEPVVAPDTAPVDEIAAVFDEHAFLGLPVTDTEHRLVGVIERAAVEHAAVEQADSIYRQSQGIVGGEELRSMPILIRSRRRLAWLSVNIVLNIVAASVIALHQDTLEAVIALAVFLPIISDMSGCSGNQAVAVSMRELTLGVTRPRDIARVLIKECSVGLINGVVLGLLIGLVAYAWKGDLRLGGVVGAALMANTVIAVAIGGSVPLVLKSLKVDPALAAGPILTTVTDMCGFLIVLTGASAVLLETS